MIEFEYYILSYLCFLSLVSCILVCVEMGWWLSCSMDDFNHEFYLYLFKWSGKLTYICFLDNWCYLIFSSYVLIYMLFSSNIYIKISLKKVEECIQLFRIQQSRIHRFIAMRWYAYTSSVFIFLKYEHKYYKMFM